MIEKLTEEQESLKLIVRDEWINFCLGGDTSIDRDIAKKGIDWIYSLNNLPPPKYYAFAEGPLAAQLIANVFPSVCKSIKLPINRDSVSESVWNSVWASVRESVRDSVRESVGASVSESVGYSVSDSVGYSVSDSVGDSVGYSVRESVRNPYEYPLLTASDSGWTAFYDYFMRIGIKHPYFEKYRDWIKSGHWECLLFKDLAVIVCRPSRITKDERGRLHNDKGCSAEWPSGEKHWFWHGTRVNEQIILKPETITKKQILEEKNSEVSRVIAERLGWEKYLGIIGSKLIDKWFDETTCCHYELYDFEKRKGSMQPRLLKMESPECNDGTRPYYIEPVPPQMKSCKAARRWQCDSLGEDYKDKPNEWIKECNERPELVFQIEA